MTSFRKSALTGVLLGIIAIALAACGGGGGGGAGAAASSGATTYTVGGTVTGLAGGTSLVLQDNGGDILNISANGSFTFATPIANGASYSVTVLTQPTGPAQTCTVNVGSGTISGANIANVSVVCSTNTYTVSGSVTGLAAGTSVVLQDNGGDNLSVSANGNFSFATAVASGANYNVTVLTQPSCPTQTCTVNGGTGIIAAANISSVTVSCSTNAYTVSGTMSGLTGTGLVLQNNGGDDLSITANGGFVFATPVVSGASYNVTVKTQPSGPTQTCTVSAGSGAITNVNATNVSVLCSTNSYSVGGTVSGLAGTGMILQDNGTDDLIISANGSFTLATNVASGASYNVTVKTQPAALSQTCSVTSGTGAVVAANITSVAVNCVTPSPRFAYIANTGDNTVSLYTVDASTGQLRANGYVAAGSGPVFVATDAAGKFAFVANNAANNISVYTINAATGALGGVAGSPFAAGTAPWPLAVDPAGKFLYVANELSNNISAYTINAASGALTAVAGSPFAAGTVPASVAVDPAGKFVFVANNASNNVSAYSIDGTTGALTPVAGSPFAAGTNPGNVVVEPTGKFVYVTNQTSNDVYAYSIDAATGALTAVAGSPFTAGTTPWCITVDPTGKFIYVANNGSANVSAYAINATTGALMAVAGSPFAAEANPYSVAVDSTGKFAYVVNNGVPDVVVYSINATSGALTWLRTTASRASPRSIALATGATPLTYTPKYAYVANSNGNTISQYTVGAGGALTAMAAPTVATGSGPLSVNVHPRGNYAYVANNGSGDISVYAIDGATGALTQIACGAVGAAGCTGTTQPTNFAAGTNPTAVTIDPAGAFAYVTNYGSGTVSQYWVSPSGPLAPMTTPTVTTGGTNPCSVAVDSTGRYAYVTNCGSASVSQYTIGASGMLTPMTTAVVAAGTFPSSITVDPTGKYVYVTNNGSNTISQYRITATGALAPMSTATVAAGTRPRSVMVDSTGKYAYAINDGSNNVSQYLIDATGAYATGGLYPMTPSTVAAGTTPWQVTVESSGHYAYVANGASNNVSQYTLGAGGALTPMAGTPTVAAGAGPASVAITGTWQ